jgi:hypothetical protein
VDDFTRDAEHRENLLAQKKAYEMLIREQPFNDAYKLLHRAACREIGQIEARNPGRFRSEDDGRRARLDKRGQAGYNDPVGR